MRFPEEKKIGFVGVGKMGLPICRRLLRHGYSLTVCEKSERQRDLIYKEGAMFVKELSELANRSTIVLLCLPDPSAVTDAIAGESGILSTASRGLVIVDLSTNSPKNSIELAARCRIRGCGFLDAPMSGGVWRAAQGRLTVMVGGRLDDFNRVKPILDEFGSTVIHVGKQGHGSAAKLIHNMLGEIQVQAIAEAFCLAAKLGLDLEKVYSALAHGMASSRVLKDLYGCGALFSSSSVHVTLNTATKDQELLMGMARDAGFELTFTPLILERMKELQRQGLGAHDVTQTLQFFERVHNVKARIGKRGQAATNL